MLRSKQPDPSTAGGYSALRGVKDAARNSRTPRANFDGVGWRQPDRLSAGNPGCGQLQPSEQLTDTQDGGLGLMPLADISNLVENTNLSAKHYNSCKNIPTNGDKAGSK